MWLGWPSSVVQKFVHHETDFDVDIDQLSWIVSIMDLGNVISPLFAGYLMDMIGRKLTIVILGPLFITTWSLTLYVPTTWSLYTARMLAGMGKGISYTVVPVFLGEIAGVKIRGALSSVFCLQLHLGFLTEAAIGPLMSYRMLNTVSAVVPILFFLAVVWISESPYYLLKRNRPAEAAECLQWYRVGDGDDNVRTELRRIEENVKRDMENQATFRELLSSRKDLRALMIVVAASACQRAGGVSCLLAYSTLILPEPVPVISKSDYMIMFAVLLVIFNFVGIALVDRMGRRPLLILSETGMGVITFVFAAYFYVASTGVDTASFAWLPYACFMLFSVTFALGIGFVPVVLLAEMFPVNIRSHCSAIASITLAFCSFVTNKMFLLVSKNYGHHAMFAIFTIVNLACALYSYVYVIETKGKTFQEIQDALKNTIKVEKKTGKDHGLNTI